MFYQEMKPMIHTSQHLLLLIPLQKLNKLLSTTVYIYLTLITATSRDQSPLWAHFAHKYYSTQVIYGSKLKMAWITGLTVEVFERGFEVSSTMMNSKILFASGVPNKSDFPKFIHKLRIFNQNYPTAKDSN